MSVSKIASIALVGDFAKNYHIVDLVVDGRTYSYTVTVPKASKAQRLIIRKLGQPVGGAVKAVPR